MGSIFKPTVVQPPTPKSPPQPTVSSGIEEFVKAQPELFAQQLAFAPQEAQQQLELLQQFGAPLGQAVQEAQRAISPLTTDLQEQLAGQAIDQFSGDIPEAEKQAILSDINATLGQNVRAGSGDVFKAKAFAGERFRRKTQAQNLALSLAGRQQLAQPQAPQTTQFLGSLTPGQVLGQQSSTFGALAGLVPQPQIGPSRATQFGGILQGAGQLAAAGGCWVAAEVFGGWYEPKTCAARHYVNFMAPGWFREMYMKFGERVAKFISDKPVLKKLIKPLFEKFARLGGYVDGNNIR